MKAFVCEHCGKRRERPTGEVNRSIKSGKPLFCNKKCFGLAHRQYKTKAQRKTEKRAYDSQRSIDFSEKLKAEHAAYHKRTYDPVKAAKVRKARMPYHVQYCQQPEYKAWKREYDRNFRAREYGEYAEVYLLTLDLDKEVNSRMSDYDVRMTNGTINKKYNRRLKDEISDRL